MRYRGGVALADWIADDLSLTHAVADWGPQIALDTEFIRTNTYFPMPGLYQVASGSRVYLIDPLAISDWQPFVAYLQDPSTVKVMHACLEDLELIHHHLGISPQNVFDTQYANAFLSADFSLSYAALVDRVLGVALEKHETRSNWRQRPLTEEQVHYAVEDVTYLLPLYEHLQTGLDSHGRQGWFGDDMQDRASYVPVDPGEYYRNVKKAWQLPGQQLAVLRTLCAWRERTARLENVPRNRVIWDDHLYGFARIETLEPNHVHRALPKAIARRYAEHLIDQHRVGRAAQAPLPLPRPLTSAQGATLKALREIALSLAASLGIAPELLARKKDLEFCVRHHAHNAQLSPHYSTWRRALVESPFMEVLGKQSTEFDA